METWRCFKVCHCLEIATVLLRGWWMLFSWLKAMTSNVYRPVGVKKYLLTADMQHSCWCIKHSAPPPSLSSLHAAGMMIVFDWVKFSMQPHSWYFLLQKYCSHLPQVYILSRKQEFGLCFNNLLSKSLFLWLSHTCLSANCAAVDIAGDREPRPNGCRHGIGVIAMRHKVFITSTVWMMHYIIKMCGQRAGLCKMQGKRKRTKSQYVAKPKLCYCLSILRSHE